MFKAEYYPEEIAEALCSIIGKEPNEQEQRDHVDALYCLHTICENNLNNKYFRVFYRLLEAVTEETERRCRK